jgi:hypothetical protein
MEHLKTAEGNAAISGVTAFATKLQQSVFNIPAALPAASSTAMYDMVSTLILDMDVLYDALTHYSLWWQHN